MCETRERVVREYEIVKKTKTKVYIRDNGGRLIGLSRQQLESKEEAHSRRKSITTFYTQPYEIRCADKIAEENGGEKSDKGASSNAGFSHRCFTGQGSEYARLGGL